MATTKHRIRHLHYILAPIMFLPVFVTAITGALFQVAASTGNTKDFIWLLNWHKGKFGSVNLELIYPLLNGFGVIFLAITGIMMWLQMSKRAKARR